MKVCLINSLYYPDSRGGAEHVVRKTASLLRDDGHEVVVIATKRMKSSVEKCENIDGVKVYRIDKRNICDFYEYTDKPLWFRLVWLGIDLFNPFHAMSVKRILKHEKPDVVHTHNMRGLSYLLPLVIRNLGIRHVHTLHDIQYSYPSGVLVCGEEKSMINNFFLRSWYEYACKVLLGSPNVVISPSKWLIDFYSNRGFFDRSSKKVVRNPIAVNGVGRIETETDKNGNPIKLLYVGQIEHHKGVLFFLDSVKRSVSSDFRIQISIVGSGSKEKDVQNIAKQDCRVVFHGRLGNDELEAHYKSADLLIMPTLTYENLPTVILEAFSFGIPVVASNIGGVPEIVKDDGADLSENRTGWLFVAGDGKSFVSALEKAKKAIQDFDTISIIKQNCLIEAKKSSLHVYSKAIKGAYFDSGCVGG